MQLTQPIIIKNKIHNLSYNKFKYYLAIFLWPCYIVHTCVGPISDLLVSLTGGVFPETNVIRYMIKSSIVISILQFNDLVFPKTIVSMDMHQQPQQFV